MVAGRGPTFVSKGFGTAGMVTGCLSDIDISDRDCRNSALIYHCYVYRTVFDISIR